MTDATMTDSEQLARRIAVENTMRVAQEIVANVEPLLVSAFTRHAADLAQAQAERDSLRLELAASEHNRIAGNSYLLAETARLREALKHIADNTHDERSMREADAALKERP